MIICKLPAPPDDHLKQQQQKLKGRKSHQIQNFSIFPLFHYGSVLFLYSQICKRFMFMNISRTYLQNDIVFTNGNSQQ